MARDDERTSRAGEPPIVGSLPDVPGILAAMRLTPSLGHLRGLADELLVKDYPGATLTRVERELIATAVSAGNDCFYCMDSHGAFASELLRRQGARGGIDLVDSIKSGRSDGADAKLVALLAIARVVQRNPRHLTREDVARALEAGATDADTQLTVLIASAFCMYNRMVDGLRARTPRQPRRTTRALPRSQSTATAPRRSPRSRASTPRRGRARLPGRRARCRRPRARWPHGVRVTARRARPPARSRSRVPGGPPRRACARAASRDAGGPSARSRRTRTPARAPRRGRPRPGPGRPRGRRGLVDPHAAGDVDEHVVLPEAEAAVARQDRQQQRRRLRSKPVASRRGKGRSLGATSACTSIVSGRVPSMATNVHEPGRSSSARSWRRPRP